MWPVMNRIPLIGQNYSIPQDWREYFNQLEHLNLLQVMWFITWLIIKSYRQKRPYLNIKLKLETLQPIYIIVWGSGSLTSCDVIEESTLDVCITTSRL